MQPPDHVAAVILAAGEARRFGSPKQLAQLDGRTLVQHVIDVAAEAGLAPIVAVVPAALPLADTRVSLVRNSSTELGMSHSLRLGIAALPAEVDAAVILLGDQPTIEPALVHRLLAARGTTPFVATRAGDLLSPPALVERSHFAAVQQVSGDIGLRRILRANPDMVAAVDVQRPPADIDTVSDLEATRAGRIGHMFDSGARERGQ
jgi:molybdenum cofactor cytidylyltransferase